jgi:molybdopterin synthase catalytic subunit
MIRVQGEPFDPADELAGLTQRASEAGAIVSFTGVVRPANAMVKALELQHHAVLTLRSVEEIADAGIQRFAPEAIVVIHRHGLLAPGDPIVFVAAAAHHRRVAFLTVDYIMDRLKTEAVFWKREHHADGLRWIEARQADHEDCRRWMMPVLAAESEASVRGVSTHGEPAK